MFKEKIKMIIKNKIVVFIIAVLLPILIEILKFRRLEFNMSSAIRIGFIYGLYALIGVFFLLKRYSEKLDKVFAVLIKNRYIIAAAALVILVLFRVNM